MASGRFGKALLAANTDTTLYTAPSGTVTTATVSLCNTGSTSANVRLAVATASVPAAADYLEYEVVLGPAGVPGSINMLERTGIVLGPGEMLIARASTAAVAVRAHGFEESV
nr:hypothetical protein [uncultured Pseudomonas sp.]